jgi:benzylsuccinate CoA-transferase BbsE subunit
MTDRALDGVRIIEFTDALASYAGRLLADLGADVIKVEPPGGGRQRHTPPFYRDQATPDTSIAFWVHNTSKRSVVLDLDTDDGRSAARRLIATAQIVIEDNPVGWMAARGLAYDDLRAANPALVYVSVTGFGQTGPHAAYAYSDIVGQAMGAIMTLAGEPADPPNQIYGNQSDISASIEAAQGALLALLHAEATGEGQSVDISAQESLYMSQETAMMTWDLNKKNRVRTGERGGLPFQLPAAGLYECQDGFVYCFVIAPAGANFPELVNWMREKGLQQDLDEEPYAAICADLNLPFITRLATNPQEAVTLAPHLKHINDVLTAFFLSMPAVEAYEAGQARRLLNGIISTPKDLAENTQLRARDWFATLDFDYLGASLEFPGVPYGLSETPAVITRPPALAEHTASILAALQKEA